MTDKAEKIVFTDQAVLEGVTREEWHGGPFTAVRYVYSPGAEFPEHAHAASQVTVVLAGRIVFEAGGEELAIAPGEAIHLPSGVPHSARVPADSEPAVSINLFTPPRKEHP